MTNNFKNADQFLAYLATCKTCGKIRKQIDYDEVPLEYRKFMKAEDAFFIFYCEHCDEYGLVSDAGI